MVKIAPSILAADFTKLEEEIQSVIEAGADLIHVDVMDGKFVNNTTPGVQMYQTAKKVSSIPVDTHLMVEKPKQWIEANVLANKEYIVQGDYITFHIETMTKEEGEELIAFLHENGLKVGIAIKPKTPWHKIVPYLDNIDMVLIMTVEPGFGGQELILKCVDKIKKLHHMYPNMLIEVDGGINFNTVDIVKNAGASILVAGTAIFKAKDKKEIIQLLREKK